MKRKADIPADGDPHPYHGPIARADGARPYNSHLWPTERWVAYHYDGFRNVDYDYRFEILHLADGRWSTDGWVYSIERGTTIYGLKCCFDNRNAALRAVAARMIRRVRHGVRHANYFGQYRLSPELGLRLVNWALEIVANETGRPQPVVGIMASPERSSLPVPLPSLQFDLFGGAA